MAVGDRAAARLIVASQSVDEALDTPAASRWIPRLFWTPLGFALGTVFGWLVL